MASFADGTELAAWLESRMLARSLTLLLSLALGVMPWAARRAEAEITLHADFEGASAKVLKVDQAAKVVRIAPGGDPARGWPCWWYVRVEGLARGDVLICEVEPSEARIVRPGKNQGKPLSPAWSQSKQASFSHDGTTWKHTEPGVLRDGRMTYMVKAEEQTLWLAWGPPFTPRDAEALVAELAKGRPWAHVVELCRSRGGRPCPALHLCAGDKPAGERPGVWLQARQHAWESGASWVARGLGEWLVSDDPRAARLRETCDIWLVPIMDIDNTAAGQGGKESLPQDHNRDWTDEPHHAEVAAAQAHLKTWADAGRLAVFVDLHNPGPSDGRPFFYVCPPQSLSEAGQRQLDRFLAAARVEMTGPLELAESPRESGATYDPLWKQMSKNWVAAHAPDCVAVTLETAWNTPHSTTDGYRTVGAQLGMAIERHLRLP